MRDKAKEMWSTEVPKNSRKTIVKVAIGVMVVVVAVSIVMSLK